MSLSKEDKKEVQEIVMHCLEKMAEQENWGSSYSYTVHIVDNQGTININQTGGPGGSNPIGEPDGLPGG